MAKRIILSGMFPVTHITICICWQCVIILGANRANYFTVAHDLLLIKLDRDPNDGVAKSGSGLYSVNVAILLNTEMICGVSLITVESLA
jgi:hypothetical protein